MKFVIVINMIIKSVCKFKHINRINNNNKNQDYIEKRNMYKDLHKTLNNSEKKNKN